MLRAYLLEDLIFLYEKVKKHVADDDIYDELEGEVSNEEEGDPDEATPLNILHVVEESKQRHLLKPGGGYPN